MHALGFAEWPTDVPQWLPKEEIAKLPLLRPDMGILLVTGRGVQSSAPQVDWERLWASDVLGFDVETRPALQKGQVFPPALVQICTDKGGLQAYVFQLAQVSEETREQLAKLLSSSILKVGIGVADDVRSLQHYGSLPGFAPRSFEDLRERLTTYSLRSTGIRGLTAIFFGENLSKRQQTSNWSSPNLTAAQVEYAGRDAAAGLMLHRRIQEKLVEPRQ